MIPSLSGVTDILWISPRSILYLVCSDLGSNTSNSVSDTVKMCGTAWERNKSKTWKNNLKTSRCCFPAAKLKHRRSTKGARGHVHLQSLRSLWLAISSVCKAELWTLLCCLVSIHLITVLIRLSAQPLVLSASLHLYASLMIGQCLRCSGSGSRPNSSPVLSEPP